MYKDSRRQRKYTPKDGQVWVCAKCGQPIDQLPFLPAMDENGNLLRPVYHYECLPPRRK